MKHLPLLSLLIAVPAAGAAAVLALPAARVHAVRRVAAVAALLPVAIAALLWFAFEPRGAQWQFTQQVSLAASIGLRYAVGIDGLGLMLAALTSIVAAVAIVGGHAEPGKTWPAALLLMEAGALGAFVSLDVMQMFVFWQIAIAALVVMSAASETRRITAVSSAIAIAGGVLMVVGLLTLHASYQALASVSTFDIRAYHIASLPRPAQSRVFLLLALAFTAPLALVLLQLATDLNRRSSWLLALVTLAVVVKLGAFGFLRLLMPVVPEVSRAVAPAFVLVGLVSAAIAACVTVRAPSRLALYLVGIGQLALATAGMFAATPAALTGGLVHLFAQGIAIAALFAIYFSGDDGRRASTVLSPGWIAAAAIVGGVTGTRLIAAGLLPFGRTTVAASVLANILTALALIVAVRRSSIGSAAGNSQPGTASLSIAPLIVLLVALAVYPSPLLARLETSVARVVMRISPEYSSQVADCLNQPVPPPPTDSGLPAGMMLAAPCADGSKTPAEPAKKP